MSDYLGTQQQPRPPKSNNFEYSMRCSKSSTSLAMAGLDASQKFALITKNARSRNDQSLNERDLKVYLDARHLLFLTA